MSNSFLLKEYFLKNKFPRNSYTVKQDCFFKKNVILCIHAHKRHYI